MSLRRRFAIVLATLLALAGVFATGASGADPVIDATPQKGANKLQISKIDASDPKNVTVRFTWNGDIQALQSMTIRQNGNQVQASNPTALTDAKINRAMAIVIGTSGSMVASGGLNSAIAKSRQLIDNAPASQEFAIVTFGSQAIVQQTMTGDKQALDKALEQIKPGPLEKTAMWDGVVAGVAQLNTLPKFEHNLILVTDGTDDSSSANARSAQGAVAGSGDGSGATVFAMGIAEQNALNLKNPLDQQGLSDLVSAGGGRLFIVSKANQVGAAFDQVTTALGNEFTTTFASPAGTRGANSLTMTISGTTAQAGFTMGGVAQGATGLAPPIVPPSSTPAFFSTPLGLLLGLGLIALAVGVVAFLVIQMVTARQSALEAALNPYTEGYAGGQEDEEAGGGMSDNALLQRALAMTESFAEKQGFLENVETRLEMAEVPLKASEALLIWFGVMIAMTLVGFLIGGLLIALVFLVIAVLGGPGFLNYKATSRQRKFEQQLPDTLTLLAGALRAGFSLMQAVDAVSQEVQNPMGRELRRVVSESRLGRDLEEALDDTAERMGSPDFAWAVMAIRIQREVGGNLAELLLTVADTMIQRERLRREVKALTAEGRISAYILALLPPGLGLVMYVANPEYMHPLFTDILGQILLGISLLGMVVGFFWMQKVVKIEI
ncbi:MAG: type II secretion system F family protein [Actinobacteria bacterium]|nr:type II secretion system F family protein [Actinomycetota bacterium]